MADFSFKRDFKNIDWGSTLQVNLIRAAFAGLIWFIIRLFTGDSFSSSLIMLLFPVAYLIFLLPIGLVAGWLSSIGIPFIGLITVIISIFIVVGDPPTFILHKVNPRLVPVEQYGFLNFRIIIFVLKK